MAGVQRVGAGRSQPPHVFTDDFGADYWIFASVLVSITAPARSRTK